MHGSSRSARLPLAQAFGLLLLSAPLAAQTTYYVDANGAGAGSGPGSGTKADPYTQIQSALNEPTLGTGDTILVAPGTYDQPLTIEATGGFHVIGTGGPLQTTITRTGLGPTVYIDNLNPNETRFEGFTISGARGLKGYGFWGLSGTTHVTDCILAGNDRGGMGAAMTISRSVVFDNEYGIRLLYGAGMVVIDTIFAGNQTDIGDNCGGTDLTLINVVARDPGPCAVTTNWVWGQPGLWDPYNGDFHLKPGSPAIGMGTGGSDIGILPYDAGYAPATPTNYCRTKINSLGCKPRINFIGSPSLTGGTFDITCKQTLNNKSGLFFYGYQGKSAPFQGGLLCVAAPTKRTPLQNSGGNPPPKDCSGVYSFDFAAHLKSGADKALIPGQAVFGQYWYRDPGSSFSTGRSNALAFQVLP